MSWGSRRIAGRVERADVRADNVVVPNTRRHVVCCSLLRSASSSPLRARPLAIQALRLSHGSRRRICAISAVCHAHEPSACCAPAARAHAVSETQKPHIAWLARLANEATAQAAVRRGLRASVDEQTKWDAKLMRYMSGPQYGGESGSFFGLLAPDPPPPDDPVAAELHAAYVVADSAATAAAEAERRAHRDTKLMISVELAAAFPNQRQANPYICPDLAAYWMEHEDQLDRAAAASAVAAAAAASAAECLRNNWEPAVAAAHAEQAITTATAAAERSAKARIESRDSRMLYFQQVTLPRMIERGQKRL